MRMCVCNTPNPNPNPNPNPIPNPYRVGRDRIGVVRRRRLVVAALAALAALAAKRGRGRLREAVSSTQYVVRSKQ